MQAPGETHESQSEDVPASADVAVNNEEAATVAAAGEANAAPPLPLLTTVVSHDWDGG